jgi:adenylate cyclase
VAGVRRVARRLVPLVVVIGGVWSVAALGWGAGVFQGADALGHDLMQPGVRDGGEIVMVGIDRTTLASTDGWPWPRARHAQLLDAIGSGSPRVVAYDVLFADDGDGDLALKSALESTPTVLASTLILDTSGDGPPAVVESVDPVDQLADASLGVGHANVAPSAQQGVVREIPLYATGDRGVAVPSLALVAAAGGAGPLIERGDGVQVDDRLVPLEEGLLRVNFAEGLDEGAVVPAVDVLEGRVDPGLFDARTVVVGVTEPTLGDLHAVPTDRSGGTPGVVVQANAVNTILTQAYLAPVGRADVLLILAVVTVVVGIAVLVPGRLLWGAVTALGFVVALVGFTTWRFHTAGELWPLAWPVLAVVGVLAVGTVWRYLTETRHRRRAATLFSRYVPDDVIGSLGEPERLDEAVRGRRLRVAVLFCDLRGFTPIAARLSPARVRELLDCFYAYVTEIVHARGGTVMQFVGDEVFAVFGAPVEVQAQGPAALKCGLELVDRAPELAARLGERDLPAVTFGIGVNEGEVVAAHAGTPERRQYVVVGDPVNVGSRLCSRAGPGEVIAPAALVRDADLVGESLGVVPLKGVEEPFELCRVG